jgi:hypothetical protein
MSTCAVGNSSGVHRATAWRKRHHLSGRGANRWGPAPVRPDAPARKWPEPKLPPVPDWHERAACRGDLSPVMIEDSGPIPADVAARCASCPVLQECAAWAFSSRATGLYAGSRFREGVPQATATRRRPRPAPAPRQVPA